MVACYRNSMQTPEGKPITLLYHNVSSTTLPEVDIIAKGQEYPIGIVHAVVDAGGQAMHARDYVPPADTEIHQAEIHLPPDRAAKFLEYYKEHFVDPCVNGQFCHGLAGHVMDWSHWSLSTPGARPVPPDRAQSGVPYAIVPTGKTVAGTEPIAQHTTFGTANPEYNVGILGQDLPMAVMKNTDTMQLYGGEMRHTYDRLDKRARRRQAIGDFTYRVGSALRPSRRRASRAESPAAQRPGHVDIPRDPDL